jgi:hypothetical protein
MICALGLGLVLSSGMGEQPASFGSFLRCGETVRVQAFGDTSNKIESGAGWIAGADVDVRFGHFLIGAGYHHRNGGPWTKDSVWGRAGLAFGDTRLVYAHDFSTVNKVDSLKFETYAGISKTLGFLPSVSVIRFDQAGVSTVGFVTSAYAVVRF